MMHVLTSVVLILIQTIAIYKCKPNTASSKTVLVFGGNGFLGSATVERLLAAEHIITIVNRGNWYWDTVQTIMPRVTHVVCDRGVSLHKCAALVSLVNNTDYYDAVIDFSAYHYFAITEALDLLKGKVGVYIFISSDSVYEVCDKNHSDPSRESDAVRPHDDERLKQLAESNDYGHRKLQCEEELKRQRENNGVPYISLRLPDVIGPRDNTYRWWIYQMWMKLTKYLEKPISVPVRFLNQPMGLVFSHDVAKVVTLLLDPEPKWLDQAYNLAFRETPSLMDVLLDMKMALNLTDIPIKIDVGEEPLYLFPSVKLGPVDTSKAVDVLGWTPTSWEQAVLETVDFYESVMSNPNYETPKRDIIRTMQSYFTSRPFKVLLGIRKEYGYKYIGPNLPNKDEL